MRISKEMEIYRKEYMGEFYDHGNGLFEVRNRGLRILCSDGLGWDHVSVSRNDRCPTWEEMQWVRTKFFTDHETVMQIHPPLKDHINCHPFCLHLWRPQKKEIPRPENILIGPSTV